MAVDGEGQGSSAGAARPCEGLEETFRKDCTAKPKGCQSAYDSSMNPNAKPPKGRITLREQMIRNQRAMDMHADLAQKPRVAFDLGPAPVKRASAGANGIPLEKDIQKTILSMLRWRKDVVFFGRFNRGQAQNTDAHGRTHYTSFNTVPGFPDIHGMLKDGRAFYIEVKRPGNKATSEQADFLAKVTAGGGIAGVAYSVEQAQDLLNGIDR